MIRIAALLSMARRISSAVAALPCRFTSADVPVNNLRIVVHLFLVTRRGPFPQARKKRSGAGAMPLPAATAA
jgi:hypothetical protein